MRKRFPLPWTIQQSDPGYVFAVYDATGAKLFFITEDDNPDGEDPPGGPDGRTVLGYDQESDEFLLEEIERLFGGGQ